MDTYVLLGIGFGLGLLIAIWGIWNLRDSALPQAGQRVTKGAVGHHEAEGS
jgi:hypothetical protein